MDGFYYYFLLFSSDFISSFEVATFKGLTYLKLGVVLAEVQQNL